MTASFESGHLSELKARLASHPLYPCLEDRSALRYFMERHVLCVFDFMTLLGSLQKDLTGSGVPWLPPADTDAAWLINSIVLDEESDELPGGERVSHFEWYLRAMEEVGADPGPVSSLVADLRRGSKLETALDRHGLPHEARRFTRRTLRFLDRPVHVRAAVFFHGREDVIPRMFLGIVRRLADQGLACDLFQAYLERHIEVDAGSHGPLATLLLERLYAGEPRRRREAEAAAEEALEARLELWDSIHGSLTAAIT